MNTLHLIISGAVQGVGYRAWAKKEARNLGIVGWVGNRSDGTVELVGIGEKKDLESLLVRCKVGPEVSRVDHVFVVWEDAKETYPSFEVKP